MSRLRAKRIAVSNRLFSIRRRLGFLLRAFRRGPKTPPNPADISSVRVALVMATACGDALDQACSAALADLKEAGVVDSSLRATLASIAGVTDMSGHCADREMQRLGIR